MYILHDGAYPRVPLLLNSQLALELCELFVQSLPQLLAVLQLLAEEGGLLLEVASSHLGLVERDLKIFHLHAEL